MPPKSGYCFDNALRYADLNSEVSVGIEDKPKIVESISSEDTSNAYYHIDSESFDIDRGRSDGSAQFIQSRPKRRLNTAKPSPNHFLIRPEFFMYIKLEHYQPLDQWKATHAAT